MTVSYTGAAVSTLIREVDNAEHARDRLKAVDMLLKMGGFLKEGAAPANVMVNVLSFMGLEPPPRKP